MPSYYEYEGIISHRRLFNLTLVINSFGAASEFNREKFTGYIEDIAKDINGIDLKPFLARTIKSIENKEEITTESLNQLSILNAVSYMSRLEPNWSFLCARLLLNTLYSKAKVNRNEEDSSTKYGSFLNLINMLTEQGIYHKNLLETYTEEEINELGKCIHIHWNLYIS
jgi:ribonucleoside-diphosphate reductase alpha chain